MSRKSKGINAERDLVHRFWAVGWAAIRVAGSGSSVYPSPDLLAGNNSRKLVIECKASKEKIKYIDQNQIRDLLDFARIFGAESWIGVRFNKMEWHFLNIEDLIVTKKSYLINEELIRNKGLLFEELVKN